MTLFLEITTSRTKDPTFTSHPVCSQILSFALSPYLSPNRSLCQSLLCAAHTSLFPSQARLSSFSATLANQSAWERGRKIGNSRKSLVEGAKGRLCRGSENPVLHRCKTGFQRVRDSWETLRPGSKRPFVPSPIESAQRAPSKGPAREAIVKFLVKF